MLTEKLSESQNKKKKKKKKKTEKATFITYK